MCDRYSQWFGRPIRMRHAPSLRDLGHVRLRSDGARVTFRGVECNRRSDLGVVRLRNDGAIVPFYDVEYNHRSRASDLGVVCGGDRRAEPQAAHLRSNDTKYDAG
jgi:hypothetical protein